MPKKQNQKAEFDGRIWPTLLDFNVQLDSQLTSKANFLFSASTLILLFVLNKALSQGFDALQSQAQIAWNILLTGAFFSSLTSLMIVLPRLRIFSSKERIAEDVLYYKNIKKFYTREQYFEYLKSLPLDNERIAKAYANQIYSLATYVIPFKFKLLKLSGWILILSIFFSLLTFALLSIPLK